MPCGLQVCIIYIQMFKNIPRIFTSMASRSLEIQNLRPCNCISFQSFPSGRPLSPLSVFVHCRRSVSVSLLNQTSPNQSYAPFLNWDFRWRQRNSPRFSRRMLKKALCCQTLHTHHSRNVKEISGSWSFFHILTIEATVQTVRNCYFWLISCSLKDWSSVRIYY